MGMTVKSTPQALEAIQRMSQTINSGIQEQLDRLRSDGNVLSDPNNWDGPLAREFQSSWPQTHANLQRIKEELNQLREQVQQINQRIMEAGGG